MLNGIRLLVTYHTLLSLYVCVWLVNTLTSTAPIGSPIICMWFPADICGQWERNLSFGSADVSRAGTRDEPLRTSAWEARVIFTSCCQFFWNALAFANRLILHFPTWVNLLAWLPPTSIEPTHDINFEMANLWQFTETFLVPFYAILQRVKNAPFVSIYRDLMMPCLCQLADIS